MTDRTDPQALLHGLKTDIDGHDTSDASMLSYALTLKADWTLTHRFDWEDRQHGYGLQPVVELTVLTPDPRRVIRWTVTPYGSWIECRYDDHMEWGLERTSHRHTDALIRHMVRLAREADRRYSIAPD